MVLNINHSLVMEGANKRFKNESLYRIPALEESYSIMGVRSITEIKEEMNQTLIEFYKLAGIDSMALTEANVLKDVWDKIASVFNALIGFIKKVKNIIISLIDAYILRKKKQKVQEAKKQEKEIKNKIAEYYDKDMYFDVTMYDNHLSPELMDAEWPSPDLIYNQNQISSLLQVVDEIVTKKSWDTEGAKHSLGSQYDVVRNMRTSLREKLVPEKYIDEDYANDAAYQKGLTTVLCGKSEKIVRKVDIATALRAQSNLKMYDETIAAFTKVKNEVNAKYNSIISEVEKLKRSTEDRVKDPRKYMIQNNQYGPVSSESYIGYVAKFATAIYEMILGTLNDHLLAYTTKMNMLVEMETMDRFIVDRVTSIVDQKIAQETSVKTESAIIIDDNNEYFELCREANEYLNEFVKGCLLLRQEQSDYELYQYVQEHVLMEAEDENKKNGFMDRINKLVELVANMFKKFLTSIAAITERDKKWFEQNEKTITDPNFKFPNQNEKIGEWIDYQVSDFTKSSNVPVFDMTNTELMNALESEETFSKYIFTKMGGSESTITSDEAKNGSFSKKCEAIFSSGGEQKEVQVSALQAKKDEMFKYCKDYLNGEGGTIYKNIVNESKVLDNSKKNVMRTLKTHETTSNNTQNTDANQKETTTQTTQTASTSTNTGTQGNANNATAQNAQSSNTSTQTKTNEDFNFDLASVLGICENTFLMELQMPQTAKADRAAVDKNISAAGGDDKDTLKDLRDKANRFFTMYGNMLGAKMSCSMKCYKQYMQLFKWGLGSTNRPAENTETVNATGAEEDKSIVDKAKEK